LSSTSLPARRLPEQHLLHSSVERVAEDLDLFVARALDLRALHVLDGLRALVLVGALAGEDAGADDDAADARGGP
jgi:hypothetical protein